MESATRRHAEQLLSVQYAATQALAESVSVEDAFANVLRALGQTLGWDVGVLWTVDESSGVLRCRETWHAGNTDAAEFITLSEHMAFKPGLGLPGRVWIAATPVWIPDVLKDENFPRAPIASRSGVRAAIGFPVMARGAVVGVIEFFHSEIREPDPDLLRLFAAIGSQVGQFVERARAEEALRESDARTRAVVESALDAVIVMDSAGRIEEWNPQAEAVFGWKAEEAVGRVLADLVIPHRYRDSHWRGLARFLATGEGPVLNRRIELEALHRGGHEFPVELTISPLRIGDAYIFSAFVRDITERRRSEQTVRFIAEAGTALASSLEYETTLARVARLAVPYLADFCYVDALEADGTLRRVAIAHWDTATEERARDRLRRFPLDPKSAHPVIQVLREGKPIIYEDVGEAELTAISHSPPHLEEMRDLGLTSWMCVPLTTRGATLGAMIFMAAESGRHYGQHDLAVAEDLARRAAVAIDNARLYRQLQDSLRTRDEFLSSASHDLKNPLAAIKGLAQLLQRRAARGEIVDFEQVKDGLTRIDTATTKMTAIVDELLDIAKLQMGRPLDLERRPMDLIGAARAVANEQQQQSRRHTITVEAPEDHLLGAWDPVRVERVLGNLVSNAVKYSPAGGTITVSVRQEDGWAVIDVLDHGIGIPAADLPYIFERFRRGSNVIGRIDGTGIGLAATRHIVEQHGGSITAESVEGSGTRFTVRLPIGGPKT
jgi:PAS domain S-box-containing protein